MSGLHTRNPSWWDCTRFFPTNPFFSHGHEAVVILNYKLPMNTNEYWSAPGPIVCADGGCNRLYQQEKRQVSSYLKITCSLIPHIIHGDLDSATDDVLDYYRGKVTKVSCQC